MLKDSSIGSLDTAQVLAVDTGQFLLRMEISTDSGCHVAKDSLLRIVSKPDVSFSVLNPVCSDNIAGTNVQILPSEHDSLTDAFWLISYSQNTDTISINDDLILSEPQENVNLQLWVNTFSGCSVFDTIEVDILESPIPNISQDKFCMGDLVTLGCGFDGSNFNANWFIDSIAIISGLDVNYIFGEAGSFPITLTMEDLSTGCVTINADSVLISGFDSIALDHSGLCLGSTGTLSFQAGIINDGLAYSNWRINNQNRIGDSIKVFVQDSNDLSGKLTLESQKGCVSSTEFEFPVMDSVLFRPTLGINNLDVNYGIEVGDTNTISQAIWVFNGNDTSLNVSSVKSFNQDGENSVFSIFEFSNSCEYSYSKQFYVGDISASVELLDLTLLENGNSISLRGVVKNTGISKVESLEFMINPSANAPLFESKSISLNPGEIQSIAMATSFSNSFAEVYCLSITEIDGLPNIGKELCENLDAELSMGEFHPNPGNGSISLIITSPEDRNFQVSTYEATGKIISTQTLAVIEGTQKHNIDFTNLTKGVHLVKFESNQDVFVRKLVIQ